MRRMHRSQGCETRNKHVLESLELTNENYFLKSQQYYFDLFYSPRTTYRMC